MPAIFNALDKSLPIFGYIYRAVLVVCKILLVVVVLVTVITVGGRYIPWFSNPPWSEEVILSGMTYVAFLSSALAIRRCAHIRMTAFDNYLPKNLIRILDILSDLMVITLAIVLIHFGLNHAITLGRFASFVSMPNVSRFWMFFPVPLGGFFMIIFELELLYKNIKGFFVKGELA